MINFIKKYLQIVLVFLFIINIGQAQEQRKMTLEDIYLGNEFIYPDKDHNIRGGYTSYYVYKQITDFILRKL